jgi:hypothetical protein
MATTILTGRALARFLTKQRGGTAHSADGAGSSEPGAATAPALDAEDALAEFLYIDARASDNPGNTTELSREDIQAALSATQPPPHAA